MEVLQQLPVELQAHVIGFIPLKTHKLYFYLLPMVFYNDKTSAYVCFDIDQNDKNVIKMFKNFCRIRDDLKLNTHDWELVYTPWYRKRDHDKAITFTFGGLPQSRIHQLSIYHFRKHRLKITLTFFGSFLFIMNAFFL